MTDLIDIKALVEDQGKAWQTFVTKNDDHLSKLDKDVGELYKKANRPGMPDSHPLSEDQEEHKNLFTNYLKTGFGEQELKAWQKKQMATDSSPDGGFLVPSAIHSEISKLERAGSAFRQLARVIPLSTPDTRFVVSQSDLGYGWSAERDTRTTTTSPTLAAVQVAGGEVYVNTQVTVALAEDSEINLENFLIEDIAEKFNIVEGSAFLTGDGIEKPRGLLTYPNSTDVDGTRAFGTVEFLITGVNGAFAASDPGDEIITLLHKLKPHHRANSTWLMNSTTLATVRKWKNTAGDYLLQPAVTAGAPEHLLGRPVAEMADMPDPATGSLSVAIGDWSKYFVGDLRSMFVLRDPYTAKGFISYWVSKRTFGGLVNTESCKLLKFSA